MMKWTVKEVAQRAGIKNARELADRAGIHLNSAYGVWNNTARMLALDTLDKLCTLLKVKPGQLFDHEAEPGLLPQASEPTPARNESVKPRRSSGASAKSKRESKQARAAVVSG
ncbi:MAG: helix-turn-helix domain-containing protein [Blastocatellia bacterium]